MVTLTSALHIDAVPHCLIVRFPRKFECLSWAPWNGGQVSASAVVNRHVSLPEQEASLPMMESFRRLLIANSLIPEDTIGLMTAADVGAYQDCLLSSAGAWVHAVGTIGLSNARSVLDSADVRLGYRCKASGTINLIVATNALPSIGGRLQAMHIAASAKTAALRDGGVLSRKSQRPADLTGTDCLVVGASGEIEEDHCGLHTILGEMIGRSVYSVVSRGLAANTASLRKESHAPRL